MKKNFREINSYILSKNGFPVMPVTPGKQDISSSFWLKYSAAYFVNNNRNITHVRSTVMISEV